VNDPTNPNTDGPVAAEPFPTLAEMTPEDQTTYMRMLAETVQSIMPAGPGKSGRALFLIIIFDEGRGRYVGNVNLADVPDPLRELADHIEVENPKSAVDTSNLI